MPKSLDNGPTKIVPVKMPTAEKAAAQAACGEGETLSSLIREATRREVTRRDSHFRQIAQSWPTMRRSHQRDLCRDADLCRSDRDQITAYGDDRQRLTPDAELERIADAWPMIPENLRRDLAAQAFAGSAAFR